MFRVFVCVIMIAVASASPAKPSLWNDGAIAEMRSLCNNEKDSFSCMKLKVVDFIETIMKKDNFKLSDDVEVRHNGFHAVNEGRSERDIFQKVEDYIQSHDVTVNIPGADAKVTVSPRSLNEDEFNVKVNFASSGRSVEGERNLQYIKFTIELKLFNFHSQLVNQN